VAVGVEAMDTEAAVTSWVKFAGPLVFVFVVVVGLSCLVDHWSRC
jgi:hypothetical protein